MKNIILILYVITGLIGCGGGGSSAPAVNLASMAGHWSGTYDGMDTGSVSLNLASNGVITGSGQSRNVGPFTLTGTLSTTGEVIATTNSGAIFNGTAGGTNATGSWLSGKSGGNWSATKDSASSPYKGTWAVAITGGDTGNCSAITVAASGAISGSCTSSAAHSTYTVSGSVSDSGVLSVTSATGAVLSGNMTSTNGTGTGSWTNASYSLSGSWQATKVN